MIHLRALLCHTAKLPGISKPRVLAGAHLSSPSLEHGARLSKLLIHRVASLRPQIPSATIFSYPSAVIEPH